MTAHVFVVNDRTFKYHLEFLFAGTHATEDILFLTDATYHNPKSKIQGLTHQKEMALAEMIADISRVQEGDEIFFYLTAEGKKHEGMLFGTFQAVGTPFYDPEKENYLADQLDTRLHLRIAIAPRNVYSQGVTEHEALDSLHGIIHPAQMCWSLIYRKLKGKRGCTMITPAEAARLTSLLEAQNPQGALPGTHFTFDAENVCIVQTKAEKKYEGMKKSLDIFPRLQFRLSKKQAFEAHLQAYILQNIHTDALHEVVRLNDVQSCWIGNEVSCGVGMQSIDIMLIQQSAIASNEINIVIMELKDGDPEEGIVTRQLPWYVTWVNYYIAPLYQGKKVNIIPTVVAQKSKNKDKMLKFKELCRAVLYPSFESPNTRILPIRFFGHQIDKEGLRFEQLF